MTNQPAADDGIVSFNFDPATGRTFTTELAEPDPAFVAALVQEAQRMRKEMFEAHKTLLDRLFRVSQMWMAGAALFSAGALWQPTRAGWALAALFALGFSLACWGQRARQGAPLGVHPAAFNDWEALRTATAMNQQTLLSTWQAIIDQGHQELAWRARWLNINLAALGCFTAFAALTMVLRTH